MDRASSAAWVRSLADMFASQGVPTGPLLQAAGIDAARLADAEARFSADEVSRLWEIAIERSGNPLLGVDAELAARHINFDIVGYATLSSADLRSALQALARYLALISSSTTFDLEPAGRDCWLVMGHTGFSRPLPPQRSSYSLLALLTLARWVTRTRVKPLRAAFGFAAPGDVRVFEAAFDCPCSFEGADHRLLLAEADLALPVPTRNPELLALHEQVLQERLAALGDDSTSLKASRAILRLLPQGEPRRPAIAAELALSDRTLQRRLQEEGTSFQLLVEDARRELARKVLANARLSLGECAHMLGFADQSNFFRACKRWFGCAPGQFRARLAEGTPGQ